VHTSLELLRVKFQLGHQLLDGMLIFQKHWLLAFADALSSIADPQEVEKLTKKWNNSGLAMLL